MQQSFAWRIGVAVALLVGFYVAALAIALGALAIAVLQWTTDLPQNVWLTLACVVTGFVILTSIVPRRQRFEPPGPELAQYRAPALHRMIGDVAEHAGQEPPAQIYLAPDVNAAVFQRGGLLGFGGKREMIVGLPLVDALTVRQLRAVIAHEFGHFHGGDTRLGPWFYRTYDALERTVIALHEAESIWRKPFTWYLEMFLRRTAALKRRQEFLADELAARLAGRDAAIAGLEEISKAAPAFHGYWSREAAPVLESGHRAPLLEGFRRFRAAGAVSSALEEMLEEERTAETDPYHTHPSLGERIAALDRLPDAPVPAGEEDDRPALSLVADIDGLEYELVSFLAGQDVGHLREISWERVPQQVLVPGWRRFLEPHRRELAGIDAVSIAEHAGSDGAQKLAARLVPADELPPEIDLQRGFAMGVLGSGLGLALHDAGWRVSAPVGEPVVCERGPHRVEPFGEVERLGSGELTAEKWRERCSELGIADLRLAGAGEAAPPAAQPGLASPA
jgi:heat shock protein HtpX